jgi:predicted RNA-binding Zn ribbon-like protein
MDEARLALAIANSSIAQDRLVTPGSLRAWLVEHLVAGSPSDGVLLRVGDFRALRDAVTVSMHRAIRGSAPPADALETLNAASAMAPTWQVLRADGMGRASVAVETSDTSETARILAAIARSAIEVLGGPDVVRLRGCAACGRFFLASRPRRAWCSAACGNRTRVARHRARRATVAS